MACQDSDIPAYIIKSDSNVFAKAFYSEFNRSLETSSFPATIKLAIRLEKDRKVSELPNQSKVFERCFCNQIAQFFNKILSKHETCFRQGHSAQHCTIVLLKIGRRV